MPFQRAYIKAKGFRVGYHLFSLVCLLVSVSLKITAAQSADSVRLLDLIVVNDNIHLHDAVRQSKVC